MLKWFKAESVLGIELTPTQIKVVEALPGARTKVLKVVSASYSRGDKTSIAGQLQNLIRQEGFKSKAANAVVFGGGSVHALAVLPIFSRAEMQLIVERELRKSAATTAANLAVGYQICGLAPEQGAAKYHILMAGAPRPAVQQIRSLLEEAGLKVKLVTTVPVALFNAVQSMDLPSTDGAIAHLKLGTESSCLIVSRGSLLQFSREIPIGLRATSAVESTVVERIVTEMKRTALFYRQNFRGEEIRRVILSGDEADLRPFTGPIMDELGVEISIFDPMPSLDLSQIAEGPVRFREIAYHYAVPLGLVWRPRLGESANLTASAEKAERKGGFTLRRAAAMLFGLLLLAGLAAAYWHFMGSIHERHQRIDALNLQLQSLQPRLQQIQEEERLREIQKVRQAFLAGMTQQGPVVAKALQEFSLLVPDEMLFRSVSIAKAAGKWLISIDGEVVDTDAPRATAIFNRFLTELRSSSFFNEAGLQQPIQVSSYEDAGSRSGSALGRGIPHQLPVRSDASQQIATPASRQPNQQVSDSYAVSVPDRAAAPSTQIVGSVRRSRVEFKLGVAIAGL
jgi:Tfp pilus assembly PilM family ATPase/Tfp pilus assembly protein PilN